MCESMEHKYDFHNITEFNNFFQSFEQLQRRNDADEGVADIGYSEKPSPSFLIEYEEKRIYEKLLFPKNFGYFYRCCICNSN